VGTGLGLGLELAFPGRVGQYGSGGGMGAAIIHTALLSLVAMQ